MGRFFTSVLLAMFVAHAHAQPAAWPNKSVRVVAPFVAGGCTGIIARVIELT